jgi:flagellar biosynthetic protein FlhB
MDKARREGRYPASRELLGAVQFLAFAYVVTAFGSGLIRQFGIVFRSGVELAFRSTSLLVDLPAFAVSAFRVLGLPLLAAGAFLVVCAFCVQMGMTRFGLAAPKLAPDFNRLNPLEKLRTLPSQNASALVQGVVIIPWFCATVWYLAADNSELFLKLPLMRLEGAWAVVRGALGNLLWKCAFIMAIVGILQFTRERRRYMKGLRMSKQEIRDETKETEGNPQIKGRIRRIQRELARRHMMKEVPKATAVVVNPTHYAVAIRYEMGSMSAPRVVAKGRNYLARRIREIATDHQIPIVENKPLAQALYKSVDVGQEIPAHLYKAVAEILAYIYRLMQGRGGN